MEAKNLRIGNIVRSKINGVSKVEQVGSSINSNYVGGRSLDGNYWENSYMPIEINEQWLIDFGFVNVTDNEYPNYNLGHYTCMRRNGKTNICNNHGFINELKYVHELQNIFFALTGRELELKDKRSTCA
jgi:hypothetical protein